MVLVLAAFLLWDYASTRRQFLNEKAAALHEEAETMAVTAAAIEDRPALVQSYIDTVCGQMQERSSPGHHIAVKLGDVVLQARAHHRESPQILQAMEAASRSPGGTAPAPQGDIVVGHASRDGVTVYTSEYLVNVQAALRRQVMRRALSIVLLGVALAFVVDVMIARLVAGPLGGMAQAARRIAAGHLGAQAPEGGVAEVTYLARAFNSMSSALAEADRQRREQIAKARRIQDHLQPGPSAHEGMSVAFAYHPAQEIAGDYWDIHRTPAGGVVFCIADASGHGVAAALMAGMLKTLVSAACEGTDEPRLILEAVNRGFSSVTLEEDFASMLVVTAAAGDRRLRYASAGHEPAHLLPADGTVTALSSTGPPLGLMPGLQWEGEEVEVGAGDRLVMMTDGVAEARGADDEVFGRDRLGDLLRQTRSEPPDATCNRIVEAVRDFRGGPALEDDVTILTVDF